MSQYWEIDAFLSRDVTVKRMYKLMLS